MRGLRSTLLAMSCLAGLRAGAVVPSATDGADVRAALVRHDLHSASVAYDALVAGRLPRASGHADPLLDRLLVEQMVTSGTQPPRSILERLATDAGAPDRFHTSLLLATAEETAGDDLVASRHYAAVANAAEATADQRLSARLGLARLLFGTNAAAAAAMLRDIDPITVPASRRWEVDLTLSRVLAVAEPSDPTAADAALSRAWSEALDADVADHAVARVASDKAIRAARAGDRAKLVTLLALDRADRPANGGQSEVAADLPICGEGGIGEQDAALVEVQRLAPPERPAIDLVWTSRSGIGPAFLAAARRSGQLVVTGGTVSQIMLRCRTVPSTYYAVAAKLDDVIGGWMTGKGAYPLLSDESQSPSQLATTLAARTTRYGNSSVMRLPALLPLIATGIPGPASDEQARGRFEALVAEVTTILTANGAPEDMKLLWRVNSLGAALTARATMPAQAQIDFQTLLVTAAGNPAVSRDLLYTIATGVDQGPAASSALKDAVLAATLSLFARDPKDARGRALALRLHALRAGNGDMVGARAALAGHDVPADLCSVATPAPHFISSNIRDDDYPSDMVYTSIVGVTPVEFDLDSAGQAINGRLLVSDPPYAFDAVTLKGTRTIRYDPPRRDGVAQTCRGFTQRVRWQLPY